MLASGENDPYTLLQFYLDAGVDETIGDEAFDRTFLAEVVALPEIIPAAQNADKKPAGTLEGLIEARALAAAATTTEALATALDNFKGIPLKRTATQMVFADGNPQAKLMLVGETPGADEDRLGRPFAGASGQLLDKMFAAIGLSREDSLYIGSLINWRPPGNRPPSEAEIQLSLPFIRRHIELMNPAVVIFIGSLTAKALLETTQSLTRLRGKWTDYKSEGLETPIPALCMFNPAYLLHSPAEKGLAWQDLLLLKAKLRDLKII